MGKQKKSSRFGARNEEELRKQYEEHVEATSGKRTARVHLQDGMNIWWVLPKVGNMPRNIHRVRVHYNPFHLCGREGTWPDPDDLNKSKPDTDFSKCYRCMGAWRAYEAAGAPGTGNPKNQNVYKSKFKKDMSAEQGAMQVVDFTGFFKMEDGEPVVDTVMIDNYFDIYLDCVSGNLERLEELPKELQESAEAGVSVVLANQDLSNQIDTATKKTVKRAEKLDEKEVASQGPAMFPEGYLVWFDRTNDLAKSFPDGKGGVRHPKKYAVQYLTPLELGDDWPQDLDRLWDAAESQVVDISNPRNELDVEGDEPSLDELARGLVRLSDDELADYLEGAGHSFTVAETYEGPEDDDDSSADLSDPDSLLSESSELVIGEEQRAEVAEARRKLRGESTAE